MYFVEMPFFALSFISMIVAVVITEKISNKWKRMAVLVVSAVAISFIYVLLIIKPLFSVGL
jgi:hypothetical protein